MSDESKVEEVQGVGGRRKFLKTAAQVAVTAPAAVILLNATTIRPAMAAYHDANTAGSIFDGTPDAGKCINGGGTLPDSVLVNPIDCPP